MDHFHVDSVIELVKNNPEAAVVTNTAVGKLLQEKGIAYEIVEDGQQKTYNGILIEGFGSEHAVIYLTIPNVQNTGYFINNELFYPGDAFIEPGRLVSLLALPVVGPWLKISEAIDYAKRIKPTRCFPVHDGMLSMKGPFHTVPQKILSAEGIEFAILEEGTQYDI